MRYFGVLVFRIWTKRCKMLQNVHIRQPLQSWRDKNASVCSVAAQLPRNVQTVRGAVGGYPAPVYGNLVITKLIVMYSL